MSAKLKLYLCTPDAYDYDQFKSMLVSAISVHEAYEILCEALGDTADGEQDWDIHEYKVERAGVIVASFNGG